MFMYPKKCKKILSGDKDYRFKESYSLTKNLSINQKKKRAINRNFTLKS